MTKFLLLIFAVGWSVFALAQTEGKGRALGFYIENDTRNIGGPGSDQAYSNGFKFTYIEADDTVPKWATQLANRTDFLRNEVEHAKSNFGLSFGQQIYTPNDTSRSDLITDDRPYAGWLYLGVAGHIKNENRAHFVEVDAGVVGPEAMGEKVQNEFHRMIQDEYAQGWRNQLQTEPTLELSYQQRVKYYELQDGDRFGKYFDVIPYFGGNLGNVLVAAHAGVIARLGMHLADDFGPTRPSASDGDAFVTPTAAQDDQKHSFYVYGGIRGNAIARDIFLDGNTFRDSQRVKKYPFTTETEFGVGAQILPWSVVWRFVTRSPEFEQKSKFNSFASISILYFFR